MELISVDGGPFRPDRLFFVKARWSVQEVFKGSAIGNKTTITQYICGGVFIVPGMVYVVSVEKLTQNEASLKLTKGVFGSLDEAGTVGGWSNLAEFEKLQSAFRKFKKAK